MSQSNPTIVDNNNPDIPFYINPQYVNVTDQISTQAYEYVQTAQLSAYNQSLADITTPRWSFSYRFQGTSCSSRLLQEHGGNRSYPAVLPQPPRASKKLLLDRC